MPATQITAAAPTKINNSIPRGRCGNRFISARSFQRESTLGRLTNGHRFEARCRAVASSPCPMLWSTPSGWWSRVCLTWLVLPGPSTGDLELEGEAEERREGDDEGEDGDAAQCWCDRDRADDVGRDQQLQAEQDGAAELLTEPTVRVGLSHARIPVGATGCNGCACDQYGDAC